MNLHVVPKIFIILWFTGIAIYSYANGVKPDSTTVRVYGCDKAKIEITFIESAYTKDTSKIEYRGMHVFVDSVRIYGCVMEQPKSILTKIQIDYKGRQILVPDSYINDMGNPNLGGGKGNTTILAELSNDCHYLLVFMNNGDGAGVYSVLWMVNLDTSKVLRHVKDMGDSFFYNIEQY